ncbi:small integral membrane protein 14 [Chrysoperla carnea]|uniref:small integral membrane protein 14 n=1 Tax=Chrysoperla carnea TaxID=189513 RepID=UPI001D075A2D|nr:small integral membrane protein 14 [Chrysoperla carnea]
MSDDDGSAMDLCECVWGHEMAMRRLLSLLRQSQSLCTDTECFNPTSQQQQLNNNNADANLLMISLMIVFALALYLLRPRSITNSNTDHIKKPSNPNSEFGPDPNGPSSPPPPPPSSTF